MLPRPSRRAGTKTLGFGKSAPQESDESCGPLFRSAFPEVLKATTQLGTAESDDGVGALNGPVHTGAFEPRADGYLAPGLHHARGSTQALSVELQGLAELPHAGLLGRAARHSRFHGATYTVEGQIADGEHRLGGTIVPPQNGSNTLGESAKANNLAHVVVSADVESGNAIVR